MSTSSTKPTGTNTSQVTSDVSSTPYYTHYLETPAASISNNGTVTKTGSAIWGLSNYGPQQVNINKDPSQLAELQNYLTQLHTTGQQLQQYLESGGKQYSGQELTNSGLMTLRGIQYWTDQLHGSYFTNPNPIPVQTSIPNKGTYLEGFQAHPYSNQASTLKIKPTVDTNLMHWVETAGDLNAGMSLLQKAGSIFEGGEAAIGGLGESILSEGAISGSLQSVFQSAGIGALDAAVGGSVGIEAAVTGLGMDALVVGGIATGGIALAGIALAGAAAYATYSMLGGDSTYNFDIMKDAAKSFLKFAP